VIPLARRFSAVTAGLLALAALPVWLHHATGATFDPCGDASALERLPAFGPAPARLQTPRSPYENFALSIGGEIARPASVHEPLRFSMVRSEHPWDFYGDPASRVAPTPFPDDRVETHLLNVGSDVLPVHRRYDASFGSTRFSQYLLVQGTRPVSHPLRGGLAEALPQLVRGTQAMTMFVVQGVGDSRNLPAVEETADAWLAQAWSDFRAACGG
jgi:hypothetical protein